jgi:hypothetical protein
MLGVPVVRELGEIEFASTQLRLGMLVDFYFVQGSDG